MEAWNAMVNGKGNGIGKQQSTKQHGRNGVMVNDKWVETTA
jgi:hypothetical protein